MFNDLLAMGAGGGTTPVEMIMFCDCSTNTQDVRNHTNLDILDITSGSYRTQAGVNTDITFTSKVSGTMKWVYVAPTTLQVFINGTDVTIQQTFDIKTGDTIRLYNTPFYNQIVAWLETEV